MDCMWPAVKTDCGQLNVVSVSGIATAQWSNLQTSFATNWGKLQETRETLVYGREAVSRKYVSLRGGKETTEDEPRSGRPATSRTPEMIDKMRQMLAQQGGHERCTFCGRECHRRSGDSRSVIDSTGGLCWLFPEAVRTLSNLCCSGWQPLWRAINKMCCIYCFVCFLIGFTELLRHTVY